MPLVKKLEIQKTKTPFIISVLKVVYYLFLCGLSFFEIQLFLLIKIPREENWVLNKVPSCGNSALVFAKNRKIINLH